MCLVVVFSKGCPRKARVLRECDYHAYQFTFVFRLGNCLFIVYFIYIVCSLFLLNKQYRKRQLKSSITRRKQQRKTTDFSAVFHIKVSIFCFFYIIIIIITPQFFYCKIFLMGVHKFFIIFRFSKINKYWPILN